MSEPLASVVVIDDDPGVRDAVARLLRSVGLRPILFASASQFLEAPRPDGPACLVLDVRLPGRSGIDLQRELAAANIHHPIVFITGHGDIPMSVRAMKAGAIEFLTKPFRDQDLLDAIYAGIEEERARLESERILDDLRGRFDALSEREREVMTRVVAGRLNKQIAAELGISEITVKAHRARAMKKMGASSLPDLARMVDKLHL